MRLAVQLAIFSICFGTLAGAAAAEDPKDKGRAPAKDGPDSSAAVDKIVDKMMAFDKNKDGKLTRDEITDERLLRLFDRADTNKDGVVTKEELIALAKKMVAEETADGGRRGAPRGPGGPGGRDDGDGPGGRRPGGPGGPGGRGPGGAGDDDGPPGRGPGGPGGRGPGRFGGPPPLGQILPPFLQEVLKLTDEQKKQVEELQKEVDGKLGKILTAEQKKQLKEMRQRFGGGPGGRGPGGPGGPGGRGDDRPPR